MKIKKYLDVTIPSMVANGLEDLSELVTIICKAHPEATKEELMYAMDLFHAEKEKCQKAKDEYHYDESEFCLDFLNFLQDKGIKFGDAISGVSRVLMGFIKDGEPVQNQESFNKYANASVKGLHMLFEEPSINDAEEVIGVVLVMLGMITNLSQEELALVLAAYDAGCLEVEEEDDEEEEVLTNMDDLVDDKDLLNDFTDFLKTKAISPLGNGCAMSMIKLDRDEVPAELLPIFEKASQDGIDSLSEEGRELFMKYVIKHAE